MLKVLQLCVVIFVMNAVKGWRKRLNVNLVDENGETTW